MKKNNYLIIAIVFLVIILMAVGMRKLMEHFSSNKEPLTASEFKEEMTDKGFSVKSINGESYDADHVKKAYSAESKDGNYQILFFEFTDEEYAKDYYSKTRLEHKKGYDKYGTDKSLKNHEKYVRTLKSTLYLISRIGNTVIYVEADDSYKKEIKNIVDKLGY